MLVPTASTAKAFIEIEGADQFLFARKNAPGKKKHGRLEMLGGRIEQDEEPWQTLRRELREEETSEALASLVEDEQPFDEVIVEGVSHYIFSLSLPPTIVDKLSYNSHASLGFVRVSREDVFNREHLGGFTKKTRKLWRAWDCWRDLAD